MARKLSNATSVGQSRRRGSSGGSEMVTSDKDKSSLAFPLNFVVTPIEAHRIQATFSKIGLAAKPSISIRPPTNPPTPTPSYPSTPVSGFPPRNGPFGFSSITEAIDRAALKQDIKPSLKIALRTLYHDDVLPLSSRSAIRAFLAGWSINYLLQVALPTILRRKSPKEALQSLTAFSHQRIGAAFALFALIYRTTSYFLAYFRLKVLSSLHSLAPLSLQESSIRARILARLVRLVQGNGVVPFVASLLASPSLLLLPSQITQKAGAATFPRKTIALDLFTKGFQAHYNLLRIRKSRANNWIPDWCDSALLYAIGNGQLLWAFLFEPECFPKGYGELILSQSSAYIPPRPDDLPQGVPWPTGRQVADHIALFSTPTARSSAFPTFISPSLSALHPSPFPTTSHATINPILDFSPAHPAHTQLLCALLHPTEPSCKRNFLQFWAKEWKASARFISIFLALVNVLKWRSWIKDPEGSLFRFAMAVAQGATVISGSIGTAWALTCAFQYYFPRNFVPRLRYFLNGFLSSIFIFAVPASRRAQLGLYVTRLSMGSSWQILEKQRKVKAIWNGDVILLALGIAMLNSLREEVPSALTGYLRRVLGILTGPRMAGTAVTSAGLPLDSPSLQWLPGAPQNFELQNTPSSKENDNKQS